MVFSSMPFIWAFLPMTLVIYYIAGFTKKHEIQNFVLLFMSLIFISFTGMRYIPLLILVVLINYAGGLAIAYFKDKGNAESEILSMAAAVILSLGILIYFKYANFIISSISGMLLLKGGSAIEWQDVILPVGISFYTFQALSYTIDVYKERCEVQRSFFKLLLYISFFPQLIAGPIVRYRDIALQIDDRRVNLSKFAEGTERFIIGLGKKVLLANAFAAKADVIFAIP